jgi:hypothetical protein
MIEIGDNLRGAIEVLGFFMGLAWLVWCFYKSGN